MFGRIHEEFVEFGGCGTKRNGLLDYRSHADPPMEFFKPPTDTGYSSSSRWPIFVRLVSRYAREMREVRGRHGTRSTTRIPASSSCCTLSGLLESRRTRFAPSSVRAAAE